MVYRPLHAIARKRVERLALELSSIIYEDSMHMDIKTTEILYHILAQGIAQLTANHCDQQRKS